LSVHEDDNITETLFFFPISNSLFSSNAGVALPKNCKHPQKSAKCYYCYHRNYKAYFDEEVRRFLEQRGTDARAEPIGSDRSTESARSSSVDDLPHNDAHSDPDYNDEIEVYDGRRTPSTDEGLEKTRKKTARLASTVPDLDVAGGVVATTSSRVTRTHDRASLNPRSQLQRRRRDQDHESDIMGSRSKRLRTMDADGITDSHLLLIT